MLGCKVMARPTEGCLQETVSVAVWIIACNPSRVCLPSRSPEAAEEDVLSLGKAGQAKVHH